ncbi:hypothetical protein NDU88_012104 [Pleurodeles waltl]|uniref:Uncharacterized protein n=1 Tax=Pleurodeles waltl TaxID=8319 RepID=A0AAV7R592_PLEWA|nr:hypothetical protein NDU88_012104 [Pleurodeles waltl]
MVKHIPHFFWRRARAGRPVRAEATRSHRPLGKIGGPLCGTVAERRRRGAAAGVPHVKRAWWAARGHCLIANCRVVLTSDTG